MKRRGVSCPMPLAIDILAQRWGVPPWDIEQAPTDRLLWYMGIVGVYNEAVADMEGLGERESMYWMDDE